MSIEKRMQDFEKVSEKNGASENVSKRMAEFNKVIGETKHHSSDKTGLLPFGLKRNRPCPHCGEFMEIQEVTADDATYLCGSCHKVSKVKLD